MNDLGLTLAWLAVQVAIVLVPALALHALASRRGPAPGAWVATLSLGLVVALNVAAFVPGIGRDQPRRSQRCTPPTMSGDGAAAPAIPPSSIGRSMVPTSHPAGGRGRSLAWLRLAWDRLERGAAEPAARFRPWGSTLAVVALAGTAVGLLRLIDRALGGRSLPPSRAAGRRPGDDRVARRAAVRDGMSPAGRAPRGARPDHPGHGGLAPAGGDAPGRLAVVERRRAPRGARARAGPHRPRRLRGGPAGPARRGAELLSSAGALDGRAAPAPAGAGGRRAGRTVRGRRDALPRGAVEPGLEAGRTVPMLAGEGVPPGAGDPDQEDRNVAGSIPIEGVRPDRGRARGGCSRPLA